MITVLLIDDEELLTSAYELGLTKAGLRVVTAKTGAEGLLLTQSEKPDIILLDMLMPEMNGIEFLENIKAKKQHGRYKIFGFSNIENPEVINAAKKLGIQDYLLKVEFTPKQLADFITQQTSKK
jgi:two-component system alkaline phosphatase synthesis response regulator PhoP